MRLSEKGMISVFRNAERKAGREDGKINGTKIEIIVPS